MKTCKKCGLKFEDEMQYCSKCGGPLEEVILEAEPVDAVPMEKDEGFDMSSKQELWSWEFWLSPEGRRNRKPYIFYNIAVWLLSGVLAALISLPLVGWGVAIVLVYANIINVIKRLHDVDMSAWWAVAPAVSAMLSVAVLGGILSLLLVFINIFLWFYLIFKKGTVGSNKYGPDPLAR